MLSLYGICWFVMSHDTKEYANFPVVFQISIIFFLLALRNTICPILSTSCRWSYSLMSLFIASSGRSVWLRRKLACERVKSLLLLLLPAKEKFVRCPLQTSLGIQVVLRNLSNKLLLASYANILVGHLEFRPCSRCYITKQQLLWGPCGVPCCGDAENWGRLPFTDISKLTYQKASYNLWWEWKLGWTQV